MTDTREDLIQLLSFFADGYSVENWYIVDGTKVCEIVDHLMANGATVQKWTSVAERLPDLTMDRYEDEDGSTGSAEISDWVWGITAENMQARVRYETGPVFQGWYEEDGKTWEITHWMPLPAMPEVSDDH